MLNLPMLINHCDHAELDPKVPKNIQTYKLANLSFPSDQWTRSKLQKKLKLNPKLAKKNPCVFSLILRLQSVKLSSITLFTPR